MSFLLPLGKQHKSNHYLLRCAHCEYAEKVELKSDGFDTWVNPDCKPDDERLVDTLPTQCPVCAHKLIITLIPIHIYH